MAGTKLHLGRPDVVGGQAHFSQIPAVNQEWDRRYLEELAMSNEEAIHVLIRDQAGFHLRAGDPMLPERVRIIDLPPYCPDLNPCEQLWDLVKDGIGNKVFDTMEELSHATLPVLQRWDPILVTLLGVVTLVRLLQELNAKPRYW